MWGWNSVETLWQDFRYGLRMLKKSPAFTAVAVLTIALGIGATTAIFSVMYALLLRPLPVPNPDELVEVTPSYHPDANMHAYAVWEQIQARRDGFSGLFAYSFNEAAFHLTSAGETRRVSGLYVSGDYFSTLGVSPALGRTLNKSDDQPGAAPVCMISYGLWQRQFGHSPSVIGSTLSLDGHPFEIVGVTPRRFFGVKLGVTLDVFVPLAAEPAFDAQRPMHDDPHFWWLSIGGRLKPGVSIPQASARLQVLGSAIYRAALPPDDEEIERTPNLTLVARSIGNGICYLRFRYSEALWLLMMMVAVVLLIACLNLANLLLVRSTARQREIATRLAVGASRWQLVRQLLAESTALTLAGAAAGLILAHWGSAMLVSAVSIPAEPFFLDLSWDLRLAGFCTCTTALCALLIGLAPALRATGVSMYSAMKSGSMTLAGSSRFSGVPLIVTQVALSTVLLVGAGLLVRTVQTLLSKDPGYEPRGLLHAAADLGESHESPQRQAFVADQLLTEFRSLPGVISVARAGNQASQNTKPNVIVQMPGGSERRYRTFILLVSPDFFSTRHTPLLAGRAFTKGDGKTSPAVAILSETAAHSFLPGINPVGLTYRQIDWSRNGQGDPVEIVGIVKDMQYQRPDSAPLLVVYRPITQGTMSRFTMGQYELRFAGSLSEITARLKEAARRVDGHLSLDIQMGSAAINGTIQRERLTAMIAMFFSLLTMMLGVIGIYGVTSYVVSQRTYEIGVRMALGAQPGDVYRMILRDAVTAVAVGIVLGGTAGFFLAPTIREMLYQVSPGDPLTFAVAACLMLFVATIAALIPAYRASRVDPVIALRSE
jgi:predicted permease